MIIFKKPVKEELFKRHIIMFPRGRDALDFLFKILKKYSMKKILLPSYIGISPKEGSGVFDPVKSNNLDFEFYRLQGMFEIDLSDFKRKLNNFQPDIVLFIHYFGFVSKNFYISLKLAKEKNIITIEDEAHSWLSDLIGGISGRESDASIFSFHKMLPFEKGGALVLNQNLNYDIRLNIINSCKDIQFNCDYFQYNLKMIANKRRINFNILLKILIKSKKLEIVFNKLPYGTIPQSFPILLKDSSVRDMAYYCLNDRGFGVVALYHTLISEIDKKYFNQSHHISKRILNLPVHQEINTVDLKKMVENLLKII